MSLNYTGEKVAKGHALHGIPVYQLCLFLASAVWDFIICRMMKFVKGKCRIGICEQKPSYVYWFFCSHFTTEKSSSLTRRGKIREEKKERKVKAAVVTIGIEEESWNWKEEEEKIQKKQFWRFSTCSNILNAHKEVWWWASFSPPIWYLSFAFKAYLTVLCPLKARASPCSSGANERQIFLQFFKFFLMLLLKDCWPRLYWNKVLLVLFRNSNSNSLLPWLKKNPNQTKRRIKSPPQWCRELD